jgi:hypothetical protein
VYTLVPIYFFVAVLGVEPNASHMLGKHSTTKLTKLNSYSNFVFIFLNNRELWACLMMVLSPGKR